MSPKLTPSNPEDVISIVDIFPSITTLSLPFQRVGVIKVGSRATIVKLATGHLAVFSPIAITPSVRSKLTSLGDRVTYLIAPDLEHHIFLSAWHAVYPSAHVIAPEGLREKRSKNKDQAHVPISTILTAKNKHTIKVSEEFDREFEYEMVDGHINKELVFLHKPSKTLIQGDFLWNLPATEQYSKSGTSAQSGIPTRLMTWMTGTAGHAMGQRRFQWWLASSPDRDSFNKSVGRIDGWDFENVVPCHGDVILGHGKEIFRKVFQWHREAEAKGK